LLLSPFLGVYAADGRGGAGTGGWNCGFEGADGLPAGWKREGAVSIVPQDAFKGANALVLERGAAEREKPCTVSGPGFPVAVGTWEFACAAASDLESPDASFSGEVAVETLDAGGAVLERTVLADPFGKRPWQLSRKRLAISAKVAAARFTAKLNKTIGRFRVDELSATPVLDERKPSAVERIVIKAPPLGNLFKPGDPRTFTVTVEATRELAEAERVVTWTVRDYWSAEQAPAATVTVAAAGRNKDRFRYTGGIDCAGIPLEIGRYYEIHAQVPLADTEPYRNWTSFAILPIAPAKAYRPAQIPFASRNWDNRVGEYQLLADRAGVRILGLWGDNGIATAAKCGMGILTGAPGGVHAIEHHLDGYEKWTDEAMRADIRNFFAKNGKHQPGPIVITLGNEPNNTGERLKEAVHAYKIAYAEIKKVAPETVVVATSVGATEEYFQLGYQDACDAFDFHTYESPRDVRAAIASYQALMQKYNCVKPLWSTEIGLNAQGMTRQYIAGDMARKIVAFFAAGGANLSWFGYNYPDADAKAAGTTGDAFNMVDSRYNVYSPRLDYLMYYNLVNGMLAKAFAQERTWKDGISGCLFRDGDGNCFTVLWKDKGRADVGLPLPGVKAVRCVRIDGRVSQLAAGGAGVGLSIGEDPLLLEYRGPATLPAALAEPVLRVARAPERLVRGAAATIELATKADPKLVTVLAPPAWTVERDKANPLRFTVTSPEGSLAKAGDLLVRLAGTDGTIHAELSYRPDIAGRLGVEIHPVPAATLGGQPSAQLVVRNLGAQPQTVSWTFALTGEQIMAKGEFAPVQPATAFLADTGSGSVTVPANGAQTVTLPLSGIVPLRLYHAKATITDANGGSISSTRVLGGFAAVPRTTAMTLDGSLDEPAWAKATPCLLNQADQYFGLTKANVWKGPADLSATLRCLWDDQFLYLGVEVTDDIFANRKADGEIWAGDGLQFLFDPARHQAEKPGKYDAGFAVGGKGPQAWYWLTGTPAVNAGVQPEITVAMKRGANGNATYEVAIPWAKLAPFTPAPGANLGACMIVNEDDGPGRASFIGWFGNPHTKQIDTAGDLVLMGSERPAPPRRFWPSLWPRWRGARGE
jgi:hypothetical protein